MEVGKSEPAKNFSLGVFMKAKVIFSVMLVMALALGLTFVSCDNGTTGGGTNTDPKSVTVTGIPGSGSIGLWVFAELPQGSALPINTAIQVGTLSAGTIFVSLVVPEENTWNTGPVWTGNGDYYVALVPIGNSQWLFNQAFFFTNGGETPVKVAFNQAHITLDFSKFK